MELSFAQAATPEFFASQRGDIFGSKLDIMASQQSLLFEDDTQQMTSTHTDLLHSTMQRRASMPVRIPSENGTMHFFDMQSMLVREASGSYRGHPLYALSAPGSDKHQHAKPFCSARQELFAEELLLFA